MTRFYSVTFTSAFLMSEVIASNSPNDETAQGGISNAA